MAIHHYVFGVPYPVDYLEKYKSAYLHRVKKEKHTPQIQSGYIIPQDEKHPNPGETVARVQSHLKNNNRETNQTRYLEQIYHLCQQHKIKFYVAIAPVRKDYIQALGNETDKHLFRELLAFTKRAQIPVLNEMRNPTFTEAEFFDCDHLNRAGANHFTEILLDFIKE